MALKKSLVFIRLVVLFCVLNPGVTHAQIVPDKTLPTNSSVNHEGKIERITGGSQSGNNLFHSFTQFSVPTGITAYFDNGLKIENIISRVTGNSISNIDGIIRANGNANFFLLNPQGTIFGPHASLNIGGSFLDTTANSVQFADGNQFSAINPSNPPLLTVSVPVGLVFGGQPGTINVQGDGHHLLPPSAAFPYLRGIDYLTGLRVKPGKTLALVGGDLLLKGGVLTSEDGRIELGSVKSGIVGLNYTSSNSWALSYEKQPIFKSIQLSQKALIGVYGIGVGTIQVQGGDVTVYDGSTIVAQNRGSQSIGKLTVNAYDSLEISGTSSNGTARSSLISENIGEGQGAEFTVSAKSVLVKDGARIITRSFGTGPGANLTLNASESVQAAGTSPFDPTAYTDIVSETAGPGRGGELSFLTKRLLVEGGAGIGTVTFAAGFGGDLTLYASEKVQANGYSLLNPMLASKISSFSFDLGKAGNVKLVTHELMLKDGGGVGSRTFGLGPGGEVFVNAALIELMGLVPTTFSPSVLDASTFGPGDAGSLKIIASKVLVQDGGRIDTTTLASGRGGSLTITASDSIEVSGIAPNSVNPSLIDSSANILDASLQTLYNLPPKPSGSPGDVTINTGRLSVTNGGLVSVQNQGLGNNAGTLRVNADSINLDNQGGITASTANGSGGDINLHVSNQLNLDHNSIISATAGGQGTGGNITIDPQQTIISNRSGIAVNSTGTGSAGQLKISSNNLTLNNGGFLSANTNGGEGGNITASARDFRLERGSYIDASALGGIKNGGNITLNTESLEALDSSSIKANAFGGPGGNIQVNTQGLFRSPDSVISASSKYGINGTVQFNTLVNNSTLGIAFLPIVTVDPIRLIAQGCPAKVGPRASKFIVTGRGGLPPSPGDLKGDQTVVADWGTASTQSAQSAQSEPTTSTLKDPVDAEPDPAQITEATGFETNAKGEIVGLVAQAPTYTPAIPWLQPTTCHPQ